MWGEPERPGVSDEAFGVVVLVAGDRATPLRCWEPGEHLERGRPLRVAVSGGELGVDDQRGAVLHQQMPMN